MSMVYSQDTSAGFKRPRMDGPGSYGMPQGGPGGYGAPGMAIDPHHAGQYGGMGGPDYGMGVPGQYGGMGGGQMGMGRVFPCVKLRGLPFDVAEDDIRMFLGFEPIDAVLAKRDGRLSGEAFVVVSSPMHIEMAMAKNRSYLGRRYIEVYPAKKQDYYRAVASEVMDGGATGGGGGGGAPFRERAAWQPRGGGGGHGHGAEGGAAGADFAGAPGTGPARVVAEGDVGTTILKLRGLPFSVSDDDICQWFNEDTSLGISPVIKDNVLVVLEGGRPSGIAYVEFPTPQEATGAMGKNRQMLGTRYIEIFPANRSDLERAGRQ